MGEGLVNHYLADTWLACSAGTAPSGYVHPLAVEAMAELGIDISSHRSKCVDEFEGADIDLAITVCESAAHECPVWLGSGSVVHEGFDDPAAATGPEADRLAAFRRVRDGLRARVPPLLRQMEPPDALRSGGEED
jgi:arsenate reductase